MAVWHHARRRNLPSIKAVVGGFSAAAMAPYSARVRRSVTLSSSWLRVPDLIRDLVVSVAEVPAQGPGRGVGISWPVLNRGDRRIHRSDHLCQHALVIFI